MTQKWSAAWSCRWLLAAIIPDVGNKDCFHSMLMCQQFSAEDQCEEKHPSSQKASRCNIFAKNQINSGSNQSSHSSREQYMLNVEWTKISVETWDTGYSVTGVQVYRCAVSWVYTHTSLKHQDNTRHQGWISCSIIWLCMNKVFVN